jgi:hypothetical protein
MRRVLCTFAWSASPLRVRSGTWPLFQHLTQDSAAVRTPFFPTHKEEGWWVILADTSTNALLVAQKASSSRLFSLTRLTLTHEQVSLGTNIGLTSFSRQPAANDEAESKASPLCDDCP